MSIPNSLRIATPAVTRINALTVVSRTRVIVCVRRRCSASLTLSRRILIRWLTTFSIKRFDSGIAIAATTMMMAMPDAHRAASRTSPLVISSKLALFPENAPCQCGRRDSNPHGLPQRFLSSSNTSPPAFAQVYPVVILRGSQLNEFAEVLRSSPALLSKLLSRAWLLNCF